MALGVQVSKGKHQRVWEPPDAEGDILKLSLVYKLRGTLGMQLILTGALARTLCLLVVLRGRLRSPRFSLMNMDYRSVLLMAVLMAAATSVVAQDPISEYIY